MKKPCITTSLANGSLHAVNGKEILVDDNSSDLAADIVFMLRNPDKAAEIAEDRREGTDDHGASRCHTRSDVP